MEKMKELFVSVAADGRYLGTFKTEELARLYGEEKDPRGSSVLIPTRNYPEQDEIVRGNFAHGVVLVVPSEGAEAPPVPEKAPKAPKGSRNNVSRERVQECCEILLQWMETYQPLRRAEAIEHCGLTDYEWTRVIRELTAAKKVRQEGNKRGATYYLVPSTPGGTTEEDFEKDPPNAEFSPENEEDFEDEDEEVFEDEDEFASFSVTESPEPSMSQIASSKGE